jgi:hypothetical protein
MLKADNVPGKKVIIDFNNNNAVRNIGALPIQKIIRDSKNNRDYILPDLLIGSRCIVGSLCHRGGIKATCEG